MNDIFNLETYDYNLPEELIAQTPLEDRTASRLLVYNKAQKSITHAHFSDILSLLVPGDVLVLNNTRVIPARIFGTKIGTGAKIEILLHRRLGLDTWEVLAKPLKRLKVGNKIDFGNSLIGEVTKIEDTLCLLNFVYDGVFETILDKIGQMPLPHYIHTNLTDNERYQTVYSKVKSSAAAPTAGLHFTTELLDSLRANGIIITFVTLDIGLGTFRPCSSENILDHKMHTEHFCISEETSKIINEAKESGRRVICVGTTSVRVVESAAKLSMPLKEATGDTDIFIYPGFHFNICDGLITNFHLPKSTLIMLVSAFTSIEETKSFYAEALNEKYRFFSFGDACFIY